MIGSRLLGWFAETVERYRDDCQVAFSINQLSEIVGGARRQHAPRQRDHAAVSRARLTD